MLFLSLHANVHHLYWTNYRYSINTVNSLDMDAIMHIHIQAIILKMFKQSLQNYVWINEDNH